MNFLARFVLPVGLTFAFLGGAYAQTVTLTMTEVPSQPVNNLTVKGVTFQTTTGAVFNTSDGGTEKYVQDPAIVGGPGSMTVNFPGVVQNVSFGLAEGASGSLTPGFTVQTFLNGALQGTFPVNTATYFVFTEGQFVSTGPMTSLIVTVPSNAWGFDNLTFTPVPPSLSLIILPASLNVTYQQGAPFTGATQTLVVGESSTGIGTYANWTASISPAASWLGLTTATCGPYQSATLAVNPTGLSPGIYTTGVTFTAPYAYPTTASVTVPVTLTVLAPQAISVNSSQVTGSASLGQKTPAIVPLTIGPAGASWSIQQAAPAQPWLTVGSLSGVAPSTVNLSMDPTKLGAGTYFASVIITSPGAPNSPLTVPVRFYVVSGLVPVAPLVNGASFDPGTDLVVAPNELISLSLSGVTCAGTPGVTLNGTVVQVLGTTSNGAISIVLPEFLTPGPLTVSCAGTPEWTFNGLQVVQAVPGLFTTGSTGSGPGAVLNPDGIANSADKPATRGSTVGVFGTGFGAYNQASADGLRRLSATVTATVGGLPATVGYAGQSLGSTLGLTQINI